MISASKRNKNMKIEILFFIYMIIINIASGIMFSYDKQAAGKNNRRVPEMTLHILEMLGGVFANMVLMYSIHHKNQKFRYYGVIWMVLIGWVVTFYFLSI